MNAAPITPLIALEGIDKTYASGTAALRNFSLAIGQSEFVSLVGPSGCGKSTVLRLIAGLGNPSAGTIHRPKDLSDIGFVFQEATLMPWATVAQNVALPLKLIGVAWGAAKDRVMSVLGRVGLAKFADAYPRELSGGMRMRVSVARALLTQPTVLLMDEPFAALDEITRFELIEDLLNLWQGQRWTVVFVTHSVFESVYMSQRVVVMAAHPGRVRAEILIAEPYPRGEGFRGSPRYAEYCAQVSATLRSAHSGQRPA
jgi:NitT/TauT family transport system ATP-binding protein